MKIGIIGAGKVGGALCKSLREAGVNIAGLTAGTAVNTLAAAAKLEVKGFAANEELAASCDVLFLTVPDRLVGEVASEMAQTFSNKSAAQPLQGKIFFHCSGSLGLEELQPLADLGADTTTVSFKQANSGYYTIDGRQYYFDNCARLCSWNQLNNDGKWYFFE